MQRLALAILAVAVLVGAGAVLWAGVRSAVADAAEGSRSAGESWMKTVAYLLLIALIFYVAFSGGQ